MYSAALASGFGNRILVGVCSMIVRLIGLSSTSLALCVARHITPLSLRQVFGPSLANPSKDGSDNSFQNSSIQQTNLRPSSSWRMTRNR